MAREMRDKLMMVSSVSQGMTARYPSAVLCIAASSAPLSSVTIWVWENLDLFVKPAGA